jgi:hypothetical protein
MNAWDRTSLQAMPVSTERILEMDLLWFFCPIFPAMTLVVYLVSVDMRRGKKKQQLMVKVSQPQQDPWMSSQKSCRDLRPRHVPHTPDLLTFSFPSLEPIFFLLWHLGVLLHLSTSSPPAPGFCQRPCISLCRTCWCWLVFSIPKTSAPRFVLLGKCWNQTSGVPQQSSH